MIGGCHGQVTNYLGDVSLSPVLFPGSTRAVLTWGANPPVRNARAHTRTHAHSSTHARTHKHTHSDTTKRRSTAGAVARDGRGAACACLLLLARVPFCIASSLARLTD